MKTTKYGARQNFILNTDWTIGGLTVRFLFLIAVILFLFPSAFSLAEENSPTTATQQNSQSQSGLSIPDLKEIEVSGPYCGIYSLIACLEIYGIRVDLESLLAPEYVGSFQGSSNEELIAAAEKQGLHGKTYGNLTWRDLQKSKTPMILHVRSSYADQKFNHWVAFL
ncbi:MAG: hypothetical protein LBT05_02865, partial [Planctomycetaceae bacterium]|nr:hypothetical protein [Planctomycetaceae bacterium]